MLDINIEIELVLVVEHLLNQLLAEFTFVSDFCIKIQRGQLYGAWACVYLSRSISMVVVT